VSDFFAEALGCALQKQKGKPLKMHGETHWTRAAKFGKARPSIPERMLSLFSTL
jgi:hypothetical protein